MGCLPGDLNEDGRTDLLVYYWGRTPSLFLAAGTPGAADSSAGDFVAPRDRARRRALVHQRRHPGRPRRRRPRRPDRRQLLPRRRPHPRRARDGRGADAALDVAGRSTAGASTCCAGRGAGAGAARRSGSARRRARSTSGSPTAGPWPSARPTSTATSCPRSTSPTTSAPTGCCTTARRRATRASRCWRAAGRSPRPTPRCSGRDSFKGMGVDFGDLNGDGLLDIFVSNIAAEFALRGEPLRLPEHRRGRG